MAVIAAVCNCVGSVCFVFGVVFSMPKEGKNWIYIQTFDSTDSFKLHVENENVSLKC